MPNPLSSIIRSSTRPKSGPYNILTFVSHERYESTLCGTGDNFFSINQTPYTKGSWNDQFAKIPDNYTIFNSVESLPLDVDIDFVLCHNKYGQYELAIDAAHKYMCPVIVLEHTCVPEAGSKHAIHTSKILEFYKKRGHINVFISEYSRDIWGWINKKDDARIIHHGIDGDVFKDFVPILEREPSALSVVNLWESRDWCCGFEIWKEASGYPSQSGFPVRVLGDNPGISEPAETTEELIEAYNSCRIFVNTSVVSPIPMTLLEAMSCGCAVVSTATCMIPEIIENGQNGFISNSPTKIREYVNMLINDESLCKEMGDKARATIQEEFSLDSFVSSWKSIFYEASTIGEKMV
tara:strand:+ start:6783 stop:7835 length:1053 start_codon:yes stop_codon:yes gene_type:complete